jgi:hypothetical protein
VENKGITRINVDPKVLGEGRESMMPLLQKQKPPNIKEGMCTWLLQAHMQITRDGWST